MTITHKEKLGPERGVHSILSGRHGWDAPGFRVALCSCRCSRLHVEKKPPPQARRSGVDLVFRAGERQKEREKVCLLSQFASVSPPGTSGTAALPEHQHQSRAGLLKFAGRRGAAPGSCATSASPPAGDISKRLESK
ncbi:hypothetical protein GN956_G2697 [Arapaima gigas]